MSPFSVQTALGLAALGATGATYTEMLTGLQLNGVATGDNESAQRTAVAQQFQKLLAPLQTNPMLKVANKIYVQDTFHVKPAFEAIATRDFFSETQSLDFANAEPSAATINSWVESKTNNKIKDLISKDSLNGDTRMVLVNAIYFKGNWARQFNANNTSPEPFYTSETEHTDVDTMHLTADFRFGRWDSLGATAIELPYKDSDLSMLIVLPNKKDGLGELVAQLKDQDLAALSKKMRSTEVEVSLPKFKIEYDISLPEVLTKMGMGTMFSDAATFGELLDEAQPLKISDVVHKAFIEVNEEGAEAAAATGKYGYFIFYLLLHVVRFLARFHTGVGLLLGYWYFVPFCSFAYNLREYRPCVNRPPPPHSPFVRHLQTI